jgi:hypothetical protein
VAAQVGNRNDHDLLGLIVNPVDYAIGESV